MPRPVGPRSHQREPALSRVLFGLCGGLFGALVAAPLLAMAGAQILTWIYGPFEGSAAMGGGVVGGAAGIILGFVGGVWLVVWQEGRWAGNAVAWLGAGAILMVICLSYAALA